MKDGWIEAGNSRCRILRDLMQSHFHSAHGEWLIRFLTIFPNALAAPEGTRVEVNEYADYKRSGFHRYR